MSDENVNQKRETCASECASDGRARGKARWVWTGFAIALAVVVLGKLAGKGSSSACGGGACQVPPVAQSVSAVPEPMATNAATAEPAVQRTNLPRLVDLGAGKCIPCKMMAPILDELKKTYVGRLDVQFIDVWENPDAGTEYGITLIPTQIFYDAAGKELFRHEGFFGKDDILAKWKELGVSL